GSVAVSRLASGLVPGDGAVQAFRQADLGLEAEPFAGAGRVKAAPGLAVGLAGIQADLALEPRLPRPEPGQVSEADLVAGTGVARVRPVVPRRGQVDRPGRVLHVEELARRFAAAPDRQHPVAALPGLDTLADQRRDDVRCL